MKSKIANNLGFIQDKIIQGKPYRIFLKRLSLNIAVIVQYNPDNLFAPKDHITILYKGNRQEIEDYLDRLVNLYKHNNKVKVDKALTEFQKEQVE